MKKKILVIYYSQSGQLKDILDNILLKTADKADVDYIEIKPSNSFPFPWNAKEFFDAMPECVELVPSSVEVSDSKLLDNDYDLVLFGYQTWFLHPSQPITSFLKSAYANVLAAKSVVTVIGCRNMWLNGQEKVKEMLLASKANLVGNIVLVDKHPNLVSVLSIMRWAFKGQKAASRYLPEAGVSNDDIKSANRFGPVILEHLIDNKLQVLQNALLEKGAVAIEPGLIVLEKRGVKNFRKFAAYIREKGGPGAPERQGRVKKFKNLLTVAIFVLSPISSATAAIQVRLKRAGLLKDAEYFKSVNYKKGMF